MVVTQIVIVPHPGRHSFLKKTRPSIADLSLVPHLWAAPQIVFPLISTLIGGYNPNYSFKVMMIVAKHNRIFDLTKNTRFSSDWAENLGPRVSRPGDSENEVRSA